MTSSGKNEIVGNIGGAILAVCLAAMAGFNFTITGNTTVLYLGGICLFAAILLVWIAISIWQSERKKESQYDRKYCRDHCE